MTSPLGGGRIRHERSFEEGWSLAGLLKAALKAQPPGGRVDPARLPRRAKLPTPFRSEPGHPDRTDPLARFSGTPEVKDAPIVHRRVFGLRERDLDRAPGRSARASRRTALPNSASSRWISIALAQIPSNASRSCISKHPPRASRGPCAATLRWRSRAIGRVRRPYCAALRSDCRRAPSRVRHRGFVCLRAHAAGSVCGRPPCRSRRSAGRRQRRGWSPIRDRGGQAMYGVLDRKQFALQKGRLLRQRAT